MNRTLRARNEIEVYTSDKGFVCIREDDPSEGERIIILEPEQVPTIIGWLQECLIEVEDIREAQNSAS